MNQSLVRPCQIVTKSSSNITWAPWSVSELLLNESMATKKIKAGNILRQPIAQPAIATASKIATSKLLEIELKSLEMLVSSKLRSVETLILPLTDAFTSSIG